MKAENIPDHIIDIIGEFYPRIVEKLTSAGQDTRIAAPIARDWLEAFLELHFDGESFTSCESDFLEETEKFLDDRINSL